MTEQLDKVVREVLERVTPTSADRHRMEAFSKELARKVSVACEEFGVNALVRVEGSLAKDTWLREDPDVDVFMRFPVTVPRSLLGDLALKIARKATEGSVQVERFAEHPYLEAFVDGVRVNIVPCYAAKLGEWLSATDRTPYHTDYVNSHLLMPIRDDVRLLKRFMKGVGVYGAEIKVGGFSGYLCELLVLRCGSFVKVLETFAEHKTRRVFDLEGYYTDRPRDLELLFGEPLVVVDPVDKARNVASAVQPERLHVFAGASRAFLREPATEFFYPLRIPPMGVEELEQALESRASALVFLVLGSIKAVPDVLWGQLHRSRKALQKQLELADFGVLRSYVWSEEDAAVTVFVFEVEQRFLPGVKKHLGPPLEFSKECDSFLSKYDENVDVLAGPFIEGGRWVVELRRKFTDAAEFLKVKVASGGRDMGVAGLIANALQENVSVLVGTEVSEHYLYNEGFAESLTGFLSGRPFWLGKKC